MKQSNHAIRVVVLIVFAALLSAFIGCSKQDTTATKTDTTAQPAAGQAATQPAEQQAAQPAQAEPAPKAAEARKAGEPARRAERKPSPLADERAAAPAQTTRPAATERAAAEPLRITIPAQTPIEVRLQETVSSAQSSEGQKFAAVLAAPLVIDGQTIAPKGANAWVTVVRATPSGRLQTPAELSLRLDAVEVHGKRQAVVTEILGQRAGSHDKRNAGMIGGGAALGAIIGGIAGGGKGAAIGAISGAGAGTAGAAVTGKKDIVYTVETPLTFHVTKPVVVD